MITEYKVDGADLSKIIDKLEEVLTGEKKSHILVACLSLALLVMDDDIEAEELAEGVLGASQWMSLYIDSLGEEVGKEQMN